MPWNNQNNGGPWGGGGNNGNNEDKKGEGSPWGSGKRDEDNKTPFGKKPSGGGGTPPKMPDMDDMMRKSQDFFKKTGGGLIALIVIVVLAIFWLFQCFYMVQPNQHAVVLRFGVPQEKIITEGLHFRIWPIESYKLVSAAEQTISIGGTVGAGNTQNPAGLMLSGDQNIVFVNFSVYYTITDPAAYLFNVNKQTATLTQVAESAMREIVGRRPIEDVYRTKTLEVANDVKNVIQAIADKYQMGVKIERLSISRAGPPSKVVDAFNAVQRAEQQRDTMIAEGKRELARKEGVAKGQASKITEAALGDKAQIIAEAQGHASRFMAIANQAKEQPEIARFRLYMETMSGLLSQPNKMVLDQKNSSAVPYLPLNELLSGAKGGNNATPTTNSTTSTGGK